MRKLILTIFNLVSGITLGVAGIAIAAWVVLANYRVTDAFDWALWALESLPFELNVPPVQLANEAMQRNSLIMWGVGAAFLCWMAFGALRGARQAVRPANESHDGAAQIELKADRPRVGRPLEGSLRLLEDAKSGDVYRLELSCRRIRPGERNVETPFFEQQDVRVVQGALGLSVPFRFNVPVTAPPSSKDGILTGPGFRWRLAFYRAESVIAFPSEFALELGSAPAEELRAVEATETPQQKVVIDTIAQLLGRGSLLPHERAEVRALPPADLAMAGKISGMPAKIMKWILIVFFVVPTVIIGLLFAAGMLLGQ